MKPASLTVPSVVGLITVAAVVANVIIPGSHALIVAASAIAITLAGLGYFLFTVATGKGSVKDRVLQSLQGLLEAAQAIIAALPMASRLGALESKIRSLEAELATLKATAAVPATPATP